MALVDDLRAEILTWPWAALYEVGYSALWQDAARTVPVVADGDPVGAMDDLSGKGNHVTQATAGARPTYRAALAGGRPALEFDGGDWMQRVTYTQGQVQQPRAAVVIGMRSAASPLSYYMDGGGGTTRHALLNQVSPDRHHLYAGADVIGGAALIGAAELVVGQVDDSKARGATIRGSGAYQLGGDAGGHQMDGVSIGARFDPVQHLPAGSWIALIGVVSGYLTDAEHALLAMYSHLRYGTPAAGGTKDVADWLLARDAATAAEIAALEASLSTARAAIPLTAVSLAAPKLTAVKLT